MARDSSSSRRTYIKTVGAAGGVAMTGLAGCTLFGGSNSSDSGPITIGATIPETGAFSAAGPDVLEAYNLGIRHINEDGGLNGRDVELVYRDDESDPQVVQQQLNQILSNNDVDLLWGGFGSVLVASQASVAEQEQIPLVSSNFSLMKPHTENNFNWTFAPFVKSRDAARGARGLAEIPPEGERPTQVGIWEPNTDWGSELANQWEEKLGNADTDFEIVLRESYQLGSSDFSTLISQSQGQNVELLLSNPTPPGGITAMSQMQEAGYTPQMTIFERAATIEEWLPATNNAGLYVCAGPGWVPGLETFGIDRYLSDYRSEHGLGENEYPSPTVGGSYNVTQTTKQAVDAAGSVEPDAIRQALLNTTFQTVLGEFGLDEQGMPVEGDLAPPMGQWQSGELLLAYPESGDLVDENVAVDLQYPAPPWSER